jgi:hypothetical protein
MVDGKETPESGTPVRMCVCACVCVRVRCARARACACVRLRVCDCASVHAHAHACARAVRGPTVPPTAPSGQHAPRSKQRVRSDPYSRRADCASVQAPACKRQHASASMQAPGGPARTTCGMPRERRSTAQRVRAQRTCGSCSQSCASAERRRRFAAGCKHTPLNDATARACTCAGTHARQVGTHARRHARWHARRMYRSCALRRTRSSHASSTGASRATGSLGSDMSAEPRDVTTRRAAQPRCHLSARRGSRSHSLMRLLVGDRSDSGSDAPMVPRCATTAGRCEPRRILLTRPCPNSTERQRLPCTRRKTWALWGSATWSALRKFTRKANEERRNRT